MHEESAFKTRAKQFFDEYRAREKRRGDTLTGSGVLRTDALRIFARPGNVLMVHPDDESQGESAPALHRQDAPGDGSPYPEPGWLEVAYSLLSQITHSARLDRSVARRRAYRLFRTSNRPAPRSTFRADSPISPATTARPCSIVATLS